jgi:KipI family sensor histidine kinase inhibitor
MRADFYRGWGDAPRIEGSMLEVDIRPVGDAAVLAVLGNGIDQALVNGVWSLADELARSRSAGMLDVVPAYASVLVRFDPFVADLPRVMAVVRGAAERAAVTASRRFRRLTISVCFGSECGIDFESVAHELGMREARLRDAFCKPEYRVAFIGFLAGFPYLLGLPPALAVPRLSAPRPRVPAGSVAIAAGQCGIYPRQSPGGWRLLGRTKAPLFDPAWSTPSLCLPGDAVRFVPSGALDGTAGVEIEATA